MLSLNSISIITFWFLWRTLGLINQDEQIPTMISPGFTPSYLFHNEYKKSQWVGLFKDNKTYYIRPVNLKFAPNTDEVCGEIPEKDFPNYDISVISAKDTCIYLIRGINLTSRAFFEQNVSKEALIPGKNIKFSYNSIDYQIYATGIKKINKDAYLGFDISQYKLSISATIKGKVINQQIAFSKKLNEAIMKINCVADIDGDDLLDFIIDISDSYNASHNILLLSKGAGTGKLLKEVAFNYSYGC